ncbi:hypothetical protein [Mycobacteroides salmoniphilum]|uniref:Peptidase propeptide and YPEB domain protein n=1 Tax=Mycobacteroides salmoniphilum TaxID=404941 RepID=A0A4R8SNI7_9MYCO|nr:hypothetical protein [Mycobacteroides salmoniphilum]TDZ90633.1 hypothetical protein CCUG62472_03886 [Mycobacteroides salmoniphilum]TEA00582.1 hypothetical protein CCUG60884_04474 [Mycobacteroides salmoniphilum]
MSERRPGAFRRRVVIAGVAFLVLAAAGVAAVAPVDWGRLPMVGSMIDEHDPLYGAPRLDGELSAMQRELPGRGLFRVMIYPAHISMEAQVGDTQQLDQLDQRRGEFRNFGRQSGYASARTPFRVEEISAHRIRQAVTDTLALGKPGDVEFVSYETARAQRPLTLTVWLRHDPLSTLVDFDPRTGAIIGQQPIETDASTVLGGCWC